LLLNNITNALVKYATNPKNGFCAAIDGEQIVFGARRPGFPFMHVSHKVLDEWLAFMQRHAIQQIVCLLPAKQLAYYAGDLLDTYQTHFGAQNVCWAPIEDFQLADPYLLTNRILPFLIRADRQQKRVLVHCSGGVGRTGHVLAAWLVVKYGLSNAQAIEAVRRTGRNPRESRASGLDDLLDTCRQLFNRE
jgi:protein-tyrosine phosphatase